MRQHHPGPALRPGDGGTETARRAAAEDDDVHELVHGVGRHGVPEGFILETAVEEDFTTRKGPSHPGGWLRGARHHGLPLLAVREIEGWGGRSAT